jgi:AraC-like DNA-binding protein
MPSSAVLTFSDADDYAAKIRQGTVEVAVTRSGSFSGKLTRIDLHHLWMQRFSDDFPRIFHVDDWGGRAAILFRTATGSSLFHNSLELAPTDIVRLSEGQSYYQRSSRLAGFASMSLPSEVMANAGITMAGSDLTPPRDILIVRPPSSMMARLQRLHAAAAYVVETAPEIVANPTAAYGLEQALVEAMVGCLAASDAREDSVAQRQHELIMRRFRRMIEENPDQPLYIPELCKAIGVSERTLRVCCQEHLGVGPKRYLLLRRLHLARRALRLAEASTTTVTDIATRYGFWHFGRFAGEYHSLFGEPPSSTLHRPARQTGIYLPKPDSALLGSS